MLSLSLKALKKTKSILDFCIYSLDFQSILIFVNFYFIDQVDGVIRLYKHYFNNGQHRLQKSLLVLQISVRRLSRSWFQAELWCFVLAVDATLLVLNKIQRMGISLNRAIEEGSSHKNYFVEYHPRRNRLTHSLIFEEFEMVVEDWDKLEREYEVSKIFVTQMAEDSMLNSLFDRQWITYQQYLTHIKKIISKKIIICIFLSFER